MKKVIYYLLILCALFSTLSCGDDEDESAHNPDANGTVAVSGLTLDKESVTLELGMSLTLTATVTPENATDKTVLWSSGDETVATVSDGKVFAVKEGETTITASSGDKTAICAVTVTHKNMYVAKAFSVSNNKKVYFSRGNLQYHCKNKEWRFAPLQYDRIGDDNANISDSYNGYIDLFGWGTGENPTLSSEANGDYAVFSDWGAKVDDGKTWRTLSRDEWKFLINRRKNDEPTNGKAEVAGVPGLILLPDDWNLPDGIVFSPWNDGSGLYKTKNDYSAEDWQKMEAAGAVFLPAAGHRDGKYVGDVGSLGCYWSSSVYEKDNDQFGVIMDFGSDYVDTYGPWRWKGHSVRLVRDL